MKILIIDDEESIVKILAKFLEKEGHEVHSANTAADGLEKNTSLKPEVILLDLNLPDMNGMEVLAKLNKGLRTSSLMIITGAGTPDTALKSMQMGVEDFIQKPIELSRLKFMLGKIAEKRKTK